MEDAQRRAVHPDDAHGAQGACRRRRTCWAVRFGIARWSCCRRRFPNRLPNEVALRIAAADAFNKVLRSGRRDRSGTDHGSGSHHAADHLGDIINDLQQRRAIITNQELRGNTTVLDAEAPLSAMFGYSMAVRSLSQGRASFSMEPLRYGPAPQECPGERLLEVNCDKIVHRRR